jgi:hypothetical protein
MKQYSETGSFIFLDSGVYESSWTRDHEWTPRLYQSIASKADFDFYGSFDVVPHPKDTTTTFAKKTLKGILTSRTPRHKMSFVPIIHGLSPSQLVMFLKELLKTHPDLCSMVAVPEPSILFLS